MVVTNPICVQREYTISNENKPLGFDDRIKVMRIKGEKHRQWWNDIDILVGVM